MDAFKKYLAEFIGTFVLVLFACGVAAVTGCKVPEAGYVATALAFGLVIVAMAYSIGNISGCHINPAVSVAMLISGKLELKEFAGYIIAQFLGGISGAAVLSAFVGKETGLGTNGLYNDSVWSSFFIEIILTFVFVLVILGVTSRTDNSRVAGIVIGLALVLVHLIGIPFTGTSVNPARSFGPALLVGGDAMSNVWIFLLAPLIGGALAAVVYKFLEAPLSKVASRNLTIFFFLVPAIVLFVGLLIAPIIMSVYYSMFNWNGLKPLDPSKDFVWFENYKTIFNNRIQLGKALGNSFILAALSVFLQLPFSLGLALVLGKKIKGERAFLSIYFLPVLISTVVIGQLWLKIYNPSYGILNSALRALGLLGEKDSILWLGDKSLALGAVFVPTLWQYVGYHMLLLYAGVKGVSPELREAAKLDGCTDWQVNRYVVIPSIKQIIKVSVIFAVTGSLKSFDLIYVLTNGGPMKATEVPSTIMIKQLFLSNQYGIGSAIAVLLILLCFFFAILIGFVFKERDIYGKK